MSTLADWLCLLVALVGASALLARILGDDRLKAVLPGMMPICPLSAICFILSAAAVRLSVNPDLGGRRPGSRCPASAVAVIGGLSLGSYLFEYELIDPLPFAESYGDNLLALGSSLCFLLCGAAVAGIDMDVDLHRGVRSIRTAVGRLGRIIDVLLRLSRAGRIECFVKLPAAQAEPKLPVRSEPALVYRAPVKARNSRDNQPTR